MKTKVRLSGTTNSKLAVVKALKIYSGLGLKDAKDACDNFLYDLKKYFEFEMEQSLVSTAKIEFESFGIKFNIQNSREQKMKRILYADQTMCIKDLMNDVSHWETLGVISEEDKEKLTYNQCREKAVEIIYDRYAEYIKGDKFSQLYKDVRKINNKEQKSIELKILKFNKEFGEFVNEFMKFNEYEYKSLYNKSELRTEMVDVLQVLMSIYNQIEDESGITMSEILQDMVDKNKKWLNEINNDVIN